MANKALISEFLNCAITRAIFQSLANFLDAVKQRLTLIYLSATILMYFITSMYVFQYNLNTHTEWSSAISLWNIPLSVRGFQVASFYA